MAHRHALAALVVATAAFVAPIAIAASAFVNVLTGSTSSAYYPLGVALATAIGNTMPNIKTSVQATKGSVENLNLLEAGRGELAFTLGDALSEAWKGDEEAGFRIQLKKLRGIAAIYPNYIQIVARADSGVRTLGDLKAKRISVGAPNSGIELNARAVLHAAGIEYKDFAKVEYLPFGESVELMKNRQIDVTLQSAGLGITSIRDLAATVPTVVVPIPQSVIRKINDPAYIPALIPANTYDGQTADVPTAVVENFVVTQDGVSDDVVYGMTKALWTNLDQLVAAHPAAKGIDIHNATQAMPIPLHPGAAKYYKELGILK